MTEKAIRKYYKLVGRVLKLFHQEKICRDIENIG